MADIPSVISKLNDIEIASDAPITEILMNKIGANINALIDRGFTVTTISSSQNFLTPLTTSLIFAYGCGGGGGGSSGTRYQLTSGPNTYSGVGGAGGAGANPTLHAIQVVPNTNYFCTIGTGGAGGVVTLGSQDGGDGGVTSFASLAYFGGGRGGKLIHQWLSGFASYGGQQGAYPEPGANAGSCVASTGGRGAWVEAGPTNVPGYAAARGIIGTAGSLGTGSTGGGGGGGSIGNGGNGANGSNLGNSSSPTAGGIGAGGGAGAGDSTAIVGTNDVSGAAGGPGYLILIY